MADVSNNVSSGRGASVDPTVEREIRAMTDAVRAAIRVHRALDNSIAIWRDGSVAWLRPEEITDEMVGSRAIER